jgi:hypothetical protein
VIALSQAQYHFDAKQKLIGVTQVSDTNDPPCESNFRQYGKRCTETNPVPQTWCSEEADDAGTP